MYTLVTTTYNDLKGLRILIDSILNSKNLPAEIIIVDSESTDGTDSYVRALKKANKIDVVYICKKLTIGSARNLGVSISKSDFVLISDTYCVVDFEWSEKICSKLNEGYSFVGGAFIVIGTSCAQKGYSKLLTQDNKNVRFNPSSRSIGFLKSDFLSIGGYPTEHNQGEDTQFNINIINSKFKFIQQNNARVGWYGRSTWKELFAQYKRYAIGDFDYGVFKNKFLVIPLLHPIINIVLIFIPLIIYLILIVCILGYKNKLNKCTLIARIIIDCGTISGFNAFMLKKVK